MKYYLKMAILVMGAALAWTIDSRADAVVATVPVGLSPVAIAVDSVTNKIYVGNSGDSSVTIIDGISDSTSTVKMPFSPQGIVVNPATNKIYVAGNNDSLCVINGLTKATAFINMGTAYGPGMVVNPVTNKIYVSGDPIMKIDGATNLVTKLNVGGIVNVANIITNSIYLWSDSGSGGCNYIAEINGSTDSIAYYVRRPDNWNGWVVNTSSNTIYCMQNDMMDLYFLWSFNAVTDSGTGAISIILRASESYKLAVNQSVNKIFLSIDLGIFVIDGTTLNGNYLDHSYYPAPTMAVNQITNKIYGFNGTDSVMVLDGASNLISFVNVGINPDAITVNSLTNNIYVANHGSNTVSVINGNILFAPTLSAPSNGASNQPSSLTLSWSTVSGAATYTLQVSSASDFSSKAFSATAWTSDSVVASGLSAGIQYYWRASATNAYGTSAWSAVWSFSVTSTFAMSSKSRIDAPRFSLNNGIISYSLNQECPVDIRIYDILGKKLFELNRVQGSGSYSLLLKSLHLSSELYIVHFRAGTMERQIKVMGNGRQ